MADEPVDPNVRVPQAVQRAAARANAIIAQMPPPAADPPAADPPAADPPVTVAVTPIDPPVVPAQTPPAAAAPAPVTPPADDENSQTWKQRYHSMEGRFKQSMTTITGMQETMRLMGEEMSHLQTALTNSGTVTLTPQGQTVPRLITAQDRETYGDDLLDVVQRAASEAVAPKISAIEQENRNLKQSLQTQRTAEVHRSLDGSVPNWREINRSPRFKQWLSLTDLLAGTARGQLLNSAFKAADAPRVVAFFQAFVADEATTGSTEFAPHATPQPPASAPAPRQPAVALEALAAPGRAKPAAADTGRPVDKPIFTRAQVSSFYDDCRRRVYAGREPERAALEQAIFAAQREGRIRN